MDPQSDGHTGEAAHCEQFPHCDCYKARFQARCLGCGKDWVAPGDCMRRAASKNNNFVHTRCPELQRLQRTSPRAQILAGLVPLRPAPGRQLLTIADGTVDAGPELTEEQKQFVGCQLGPGVRVRGNARAGSGKTTTAAAVCGAFLKQDPTCMAAYFVFGKKNQEEASASGKFNAQQVLVTTTHSFCKKLCFQTGTPVGKLDRVDLSRKLRLLEDVQARVPHVRGDIKRAARLGRALAAGVKITLDKFCHSADRHLMEKHVPEDLLRVKSEKASWRSQFTRQDYAGYAETIWKAACQSIEQARQGPGGSEKHFVTHDVYMKYCQAVTSREELSVAFQRFQLLLVDEAQDLTPCQADLLWAGPHLGEQAVVLLGDEHQRIYRWRGAADNFEKAEVDFEFDLSQSFRFGPLVADVAQRLLAFASGDPNVRLVGRGAPPPECRLSPRVGVAPELTERKLRRLGGQVVVLTRSNKGLFDALRRLRDNLGRWPRWRALDKDARGEGRLSILKLNRRDPSTCEYRRLVAFYRGVQGTALADHDDSDSDDTFSLPTLKSFLFDGEEYDSWKDLLENCKANGAGSLLTKMGLVQEAAERSERGDPGLLLEELEALGAAHRTGDEWEVQLGTAHSSKGMEFAVPLWLWDDFALPMDEEGNLECPRSRAEIECVNLLYVAVTRARGALFLVGRVWAFFEALGVEERVDEGAARAPSRPGPRGDAKLKRRKEQARLDQLREDWEAKWSELQGRVDAASRSGSASSSSPGRATALQRLEQIPGPPQSGSESGGCNPLALHPGLEDAAVRAHVRAARLRYHPDKWQALVTRAESEVSGSPKLQRRLEKVKALLRGTAAAISEWLRRDRARDPDQCAERGPESDCEGSSEARSPSPKRRRR